MKKTFILILAAICLSACTGKWNDIAHKEVPATIIAFAVEGQVQCTLSQMDKTISLVLPYDADIKAVTVKEFTITEGATCTPDIKPGSKLDVSSPLTITITTYDDYVWTLTATQKAKPTSDIYNMTFDSWSKDFLGGYVPYASDADAEEKSVWATPGTYMALATGGKSVTSEETEFVAVSGEGKAAAKLESLYSDVVSMFGNGTLFTGTLTAFDTDQFNATLGTPLKKRPATLEGWACYKPKTIDKAKEPYMDKIGTLDNGYVFVALADWTAQYGSNPPAKLMEDTEKVPGIIGYGKKVFDTQMDKYERFSIEIKYLSSDKTPTMAVILAGSSALGDYRTGGVGSVLYLDELGFTY